MNTDAIDAEHTAIAVREEPDPQAQVALFGTSDPVAVIVQATRVADALKDIVVKKKLVSMIQSKEYPLVEAWQTLAVMLGLATICEWTRQVPDGWEARVIVQRNGLTIAAAEAQCLRSEKSKKSWEDYAIRSMSQTRATSKSLRSVLGFIMVLAGYQATPAEEMPDPPAPAAKPGKPAPVADDSGRKMGVEAIVRLCGKLGIEVPESLEILSVEELRAMWTRLKEAAVKPSEPVQAAPSPQSEPKAAGEAKTQPATLEASRRNMITAIHIYKDERKLSNDLYRELMVDLFGDACYNDMGVPSSTMLTLEQMHALLDEIKARTE